MKIVRYGLLIIAVFHAESVASKEFGLSASRYSNDYGFMGRHFLGVTAAMYSGQEIGNLQLITGINFTPTIYNTNWDPFEFEVGAPLNFRIGIEDASGVLGFNLDIGITNNWGSYVHRYDGNRKFFASEQILAGPVLSLRSGDLKIELGYMSYGRYLFETNFDDRTRWPWSDYMAGGNNYEISMKLLIVR